MRILIVDDELSYCEKLKRVLIEHGMADSDVWLATSYESGLHAMREQPEVLLLDVRIDPRYFLPLGIDLIPAFKKECETATIIMMTGAFNDYDQKRAFQLGAAGYIEKGAEEFIASYAQEFLSPSSLSPSDVVLH